LQGGKEVIHVMNETRTLASSIDISEGIGVGGDLLRVDGNETRNLCVMILVLRV